MYVYNFHILKEMRELHQEASPYFLVILSCAEQIN